MSFYRDWIASKLDMDTYYDKVAIPKSELVKVIRRRIKLINKKCKDEVVVHFQTILLESILKELKIDEI